MAKKYEELSGSARKQSTLAAEAEDKEIDALLEGALSDIDGWTGNKKGTDGIILDLAQSLKEAVAIAKGEIPASRRLKVED